MIDKRIISGRESKAKSRQRNREYLFEYLSKNPCIDCGEKNPVVLTFDHVRGEKRNAVANLARSSFSLKSIQDEIDKCEVRCFNCHIIKTADERGWWAFSEYKKTA
jgi:hypothetical protein